MSESSELAQKKRNFAILMALHVQNFQKLLLLKRRRAQQRHCDKQKKLRDFFIKQLMLMNATYLQALLNLARLCFQKTMTGGLGKSPTEFSVNIRTILPELNEQDWLDHFRMSRSTFEWLCLQLKPNMGQLDATPTPKSATQISAEKRIAIALYTLAHRTSIVRVARRFSVRRALIYRIVKQFTSALLRRLGPILLTLPEDEAQYDQIREGFSHCTEMPLPPLVAGVITLSEIVVRDCAVANSNIRMEAIIDDRMLIRRVQVGSASTQNLLLDVLNKIGTLRPLSVNGRTVSCFVITPCDQNYPMRSCLLQPYSYPTLPHEFDFNEAISGALSVSKAAQIRLCSRWQFDAANFKASTVTELMTACCALHNLLEDRNEQFPAKWSNGIDVPVMPAVRNGSRLDGSLLAKKALETRDFLAFTITEGLNKQNSLNN